MRFRTERPRLRLSAFLLFSILIWGGCSGAKTAGVWNKDLSEEDPYVFSYDGSSDEAVATLKQTLLPKGFSVVSEDEYGGGGTYIFEKTLADDEKIESTAFYTAMTGASTGTQTGRLVFTISRSGRVTSVQMTPRLVATTQQYRENDSSTEKEEFPVKQGNPLPMKYGRLFAEMEKWQLEDPNRAAVFMNESAEANTSPESEQSRSGLARNEPPSAAGGTRSTETSSPPENRPGDGGDDIAWVQRTLNELGHDCGVEDGVMGPNTHACIRSFQEASGLSATGSVNETTYERMLDKLDGGNPDEGYATSGAAAEQSTEAGAVTTEAEPVESPSDRASSQAEPTESSPGDTPPRDVLQSAIVSSIEREVPRSIRRQANTGAICVDGDVKKLAVRDVGLKQETDEKTYWPAKIRVTVSCSEEPPACGSIYGPCETKTFEDEEVEFSVWQDPYGDWLAEPMR